MEYGSRRTHYTTAHGRCSRVTDYSSPVELWKSWRLLVQVILPPTGLTLRQIRHTWAFIVPSLPEAAFWPAWQFSGSTSGLPVSTTVILAQLKSSSRISKLLTTTSK